MGVPSTFAQHARVNAARLSEASTPQRSKLIARNIFDEGDKSSWRLAATVEQHSLCAFCMTRISAEQTGQHVPAVRLAHVIPINMEPSLALTWNNLVASCSRPTTCDIKQGSESLPVSPVSSEARLRALFRFRSGGKIEPRNSLPPALRQDAEQTIERLALNDPSLVALRQAAILEATAHLGKGTLTPTKVDRARLNYEPATGPFSAFSEAIISWMTDHVARGR